MKTHISDRAGAGLLQRAGVGRAAAADGSRSGGAGGQEGSRRRAGRKGQTVPARQDGCSHRILARQGWRKGWTLNAPTALPAPVAALTAPANQSAPSGQPDGKLTAVGAAAPITSEKSATAAPSADIKTAPSPAAATVKTK